MCGPTSGASGRLSGWRRNRKANVENGRRVQRESIGFRRCLFPMKRRSDRTGVPEKRGQREGPHPLLGRSGELEGGAPKVTRWKSVDQAWFSLPGGVDEEALHAKSKLRAVGSPAYKYREGMPSLPMMSTTCGIFVSLESRTKSRDLWIPLDSRLPCPHTTSCAAVPTFPNRSFDNIPSWRLPRTSLRWSTASSADPA